ncbi:MAG TPA: leucyl aminopeptidase family protein, partial [Lysobacter sp.]
IANGGPSRMAGSITAAIYLEGFVPADQSWAHLDVYAWNDNDRPGRPAGGEAQGLRSAYALLKGQTGV